MRPEQWAERHDGLISNEAAHSGGLTEGQLEYRRKTGRYRRLRRGVSVVAGVPPTWQQTVRAVALSCGDGVCLALHTAARWWGAPVPNCEVIHVLGDLGRPVKLEGVVSHRSGTIEEGDVITRGEVRCTSPLRTVIDLSGALDLRQLGTLLDHFLRARQIDLEVLRERVARTQPAPGRSVRALRILLAQRLPGYDPGESPLEARIARIIDAAGLPRPRQQHRVQLDGHRYRIDFAWPDRMLYLEGNGFGFHRLSTDLDNDAHRQNSLVLRGWKPIEITWRMSDTHIARTLTQFLTQV